jgi:hypothetical protein
MTNASFYVVKVTAVGSIGWISTPGTLGIPSITATRDAATLFTTRNAAHYAVAMMPSEVKSLSSVIFAVETADRTVAVKPPANQPHTPTDLTDPLPDFPVFCAREILKTLAGGCRFFRDLSLGSTPRGLFPSRGVLSFLLRAELHAIRAQNH